MPHDSNRMNDSERSVYRYLTSHGFRDVVHEPDGKVPPDFLVDGRIAVEVRRLNEGENTGRGHRGLEEVSKPLNALVINALAAVGPPIDDASWFVFYTYRRPLPPWKALDKDLRSVLMNIRERPNLQESDVWVASKLRLKFTRAGTVHPCLFVPGGSSDHESGGIVVSDMAQNLRVYIAEKSRKVFGVKGKYSEWWLAFEDRIGYGVLDESGRRDLQQQVRVEPPWSKIILVNPLNPTAGFEL